MGNAVLNDLKNPNSTLATVLNSLNDAVYVVDRARQIIFWNRAAESVTGYSADEVMGRCCGDDILNHIDENGHLLCRDSCPLADTMETGIECTTKVYPLHKEGRRFPTQTRIGALRDEKGNVVAGIEIFRDASAEEDFRLLQEKFNALIKKYVNRRLYDTEASRYITLEELAGLIRGGREVRVVDAKTNSDLTKMVLLQN